jgi:hypothetical protein
VDGRGIRDDPDPDDDDGGGFLGLPFVGLPPFTTTPDAFAARRSALVSFNEFRLLRTDDASPPFAVVGRFVATAGAVGSNAVVRGSAAVAASSAEEAPGPASRDDNAATPLAPAAPPPAFAYPYRPPSLAVLGRTLDGSGRSRGIAGSDASAPPRPLEDDDDVPALIGVTPSAASARPAPTTDFFPPPPPPPFPPPSPRSSFTRYAYRSVFSVCSHEPVAGETLAIITVRASPGVELKGVRSGVERRHRVGD